jgi:hypothetical protein
MIGNASSPGRQGFLWIMVRSSMAGGTGKVKTRGSAEHCSASYKHWFVRSDAPRSGPPGLACRETGQGTKQF